MPTSPQRPRPPVGWRRLLLRSPIRLFRAGLGPLFGGRLLLLIHTGRQSGRSREVVLEVVARDRHQGTWTVASGFGPEAQWYRNLRHTPQATIQFGRGYYVVTAQFPTPEEGGRIMTEYARRHPRAARTLCRYMGFPVEGDTIDFRSAGEQIPFVRLKSDEPT
ncbi:nitroreductase family deazaflavin-dependent oxidoreductase [Streptomyces sp. R302]|uniref:nitroreductase family deazaflavin-dependent oxidoreductase n=1 Tax=unclassified Streptomyces TaxID=2593676 RepID=UPI00145F8108|nr:MULTISPECIES: nitroreductase family deazaflavin-dependent oxidoreductase [unclassified Streptomyces]NML51115.1 nitroreductase family deazaflavin-dependent oxidoreductase [Streptomyces sp. R301]NML81210.1 nitroreductase family deazaflavin-dependent oxidoreductase [Streptomyces sp. R302]